MEDAFEIYKKWKEEGCSDAQIKYRIRELKQQPAELPKAKSWEDYSDHIQLMGWKESPVLALQSLDELVERDQQREADGFPKRIRIGKLVQPGKGQKAKVVVVPTTTEAKFYHDDSITEDGEGGGTGGAGGEAEGEILGEQQADEAQGEEGDAEGAGDGGGGAHEQSSNAFDLGKVLTEKFELPNLEEKGRKKSLTKYVYDLTDVNHGFGQILDKKATIKKIVQTNIQLGNIKAGEMVNTEDLLMIPEDQVFRILSKEKAFESQAIVFFVRDYSGSMEGPPSEVICTQHLFLYSWLMYQYKNQVEARFILHDVEAKLAPDFHTYYSSRVAGGTKIFPALDMVRKMIEEEQLDRDYNIYVFYGTDGDDWEDSGKEVLSCLEVLLPKLNRFGITVARNAWTSLQKASTMENYINNSGLLETEKERLRMDVFSAKGADENRIIESIKKLLE